jgi:hypothetical protein
VAIKAHIYAPAFLSSLFVVPTVSAQHSRQYVYIRAAIPRFLPVILFCKTLTLDALLTAVASSSTSLKMDAPTIQPKFLKNGSDLGIVAVGFSGGQVNTY